MSEIRELVKITHSGRCPICNGELPSGRFYCSKKCQKAGHKLGIVAQSGNRKYEMMLRAKKHDKV